MGTPMRRGKAMRKARLLTATLLVAVLFPFAMAGSARADTPLGTYIVTFDTPPDAEQLTVLSGVALSVHGFEHLPSAVVVIDPVDAGLLRHLPGVTGVYPSHGLTKMLRQSTRTIRADAAWNLGYTGAGVGVAVIDTGIDGTRPDVCAAPEFCNGTPVRTVQNVKFVGYQSGGVDPIVTLENQANTDTSSGHGTHVAGIVGSAGVSSAYEPLRYRGVAPDSNLIGLGTGEVLSVDNVLAAFDWVIEHRVQYNIRVINNSWGPDPGTPFDPNDPVHRAIGAAHDAGMAVVFGSGNAGPTTDTLNAFSVNPKAISVAGGSKNGHIAFFSSRGVPGSSFWRPTVTAPGYNIASVRASTGFYGDVADATAPNPDVVLPPDDVYYASASGTSMASPHVAGIIALMQQASFQNRGVYLTPDEARNILQNTAVSRDAARGPGGLPSYQHYSMGAGYADALAAVQAAAAGTNTQPYDPHVTYDVRGFTGALSGQTSSFTAEIAVQPGAISLDVMADWGFAANDVDVDLFSPSGAFVVGTGLRCAPDAEPNGYSSFCTQVANERNTVVSPAPGAWRAVVHTFAGAPAVPDTVRGLWSVAYPDTVAVAAQAPASVTVVPATPVGVAGQAVKVTATVRDAAGNPIPNAPATWSSAGAGAVTFGETLTKADGTVDGAVLSSTGGTQTITVTAGAAGSATVTWLGLPGTPNPTNTPGAASGGGWFDNPNKRHFAFWGEYDAGDAAASGEMTFDDRSGTKARAASITSFAIAGTKVTIAGTATVNGAAGYSFTIEAVDNGEPGVNDTFKITLTKDADPLWSYSSSGTLGGGNIQVET